MQGRLLSGLVGLFACGALAAGADLKEAQKQFLSGDYSAAIALAQQAIGEKLEQDEWPLLLTRALLETGRYAEAQAAITNALERDRTNIRLCWQAREALQANGQREAARDMTQEILRRVYRHRDDYTDAPSLVILGQAALLGGADPKRVLDMLFEVARKADPNSREVYLASGNLALEKHDFALAAKKFEEGLKQLPDDPDLHFGLARAYAPGDSALMSSEVETALQHNSNHVGCLLLLVEHNIDAEDYTEAANLLERVQAINPWRPEAWAYRAVLAHFENRPEAEREAREIGLKFWRDNPLVDYLIGLKLSQSYRFAEGSRYQRQALAFDPSYLAAKAQLAQDLLRLGEEAEGWKLAEEVQKQDNYDVQAYNLTALHDTMSKFATLTNADFVLRMSRHEAELYGHRVLELLARAQSNLCAKYGVELKRPTTVEVFPEQKDFAVRTFGMPGNPGYLGVCFGRVVTANSPAAHVGHSVNWQAVLWHEFCHVVTLQMTQNKMPRWLSEGISVHEELQANPTWGQRMNPDYREMVLEDELTPVAKLSEAFLAPRSPEHLQFAYYESSLVVEFLVQRFGMEKLKAVLRDLGAGLEINHALETNTAPMDQLEKDFAAFARERAEALAPGLDWEKPEFQLAGGAAHGPPRTRRRSQGSATTNAPAGAVKPRPVEEAWDVWAKTHPTNFWALAHQGEELVAARQWPEAKGVLEKLLELYPGFTGPDSPYRLLATAHRELGETNAERQVLGRLAEQDDEAADAYRRLMELGTTAKDWPAVAQNADRYLAVDPLVALPYRFLAQASEQTGEPRVAITAYRALLQLDPPDPAEVHFQLARALHRIGDPEARRQVLQALEEAPRYREALRLLLEINGETSPTRIDDATERGRQTSRLPADSPLFQVGGRDARPAVEAQTSP
jgi:tetratricopeptide (TPR) repeat protein